MKYVSTTRNLGLLYGHETEGMASGPLIGYVDSDWAGDQDCRYSRGGYIFTSWTTPVVWQSKKMEAAASSSCESEYMAASKAARESIWMRFLLNDMGYDDLRPETYGKCCDQDYARVRLSDLVDPNEKPVMCMIDNKGALALSQNPVLHKRSKHIHIHYHVVRRLVNEKQLSMAYIGTKDNIADLMTKGLGKVVHERLTAKIMAAYDGEKVTNVRGNELKSEQLEPSTRDLYLSEPMGLNPSESDINILRDGRVLPQVRKDGHRVPGVAIGPEKLLRLKRSGLPEKLTGVLDSDVPRWYQDKLTGARQEAVHLVIQAVKGACRQVCEAIVRKIAASAGRTAKYAIVDSGASRTFVPGSVQLRNSRRGTGTVSCANEQAENIVEEGELGPLEDAQKVMSFARILVSVADLVRKYGVTAFDEKGVHVVSKCRDGTLVSTQIGEKTRERLYSFDLRRLESHDLTVRASGGLQDSKTGVGALMYTWGCAKGACPAA